MLVYKERTDEPFLKQSCELLSTNCVQKHDVNQILVTFFWFISSKDVNGDHERQTCFVLGAEQLKYSQD